jgi:hypothetical protein
MTELCHKRGRNYANLGRGKFVKTVSLDKHKNVAVMTTKPGIGKYAAFAAKITSLEPTICCFVATGAPQPSVAEVTNDDESIGPSADSDHESDSDDSTGGARTTLRAKSSAKSEAHDIERDIKRDIRIDVRNDVIKRNGETQANRFPISTEHARTVNRARQPTQE